MNKSHESPLPNKLLLPLGKVEKISGYKAQVRTPLSRTSPSLLELGPKEQEPQGSALYKREGELEATIFPTIGHC